MGESWAAVSDLQFTPGSPADEGRGLLGYVSFRLGDRLLVDGVTVRRTTEGRLTVSFPARRDRAGRDHYILRPVDDPSRRHLELQILDGIRAQGGL